MEQVHTGMKLKPGSIVRICDPYDKDWWQVECNGEKGVFPSNTLEIVNKATVKAVAMFDFSSPEPEEIDFKTDNVIKYFSSHDVNRFKGAIRSNTGPDRTGFFPYRYVRFHVGDDPPGLGIPKVVDPPMLRKAKVIEPYYAMERGELSLEVDEIVEILGDNNGWLKGRIGNYTGVFPCTFIEFIGNGKKAPEPKFEEGEKKVGNDDISKQLICAICLEYAEEAVETSCCHNVFCKPCLEMVSRTCCPQCRKQFTIQVAHLARRIIGELEAQCPNESCNVKTTRSELKYHLSNCEFRLYECKQCDFKGVKIKFARHLVNKHIDGVMESCKHFYKE